MNQDWINDWYLLGRVAEVAPGSVIRKRVGRNHIALFNLDGVFFAQADACAECDRGLSDGRIKNTEVLCAGCGRRVPIGKAHVPSAPPSFPLMVVDDEVFAWIENLSESLQR